MHACDTCETSQSSTDSVFYDYDFTWTGIDNTDFDGPSLVTIFQNSDPFQGLLFGTMGASLATMLFYLLQFKHNSRIVPPTPMGCCRSSDAVTDPAVTDVPRPLLNASGCVESWLLGLNKIFPAIVVLSLAWTVAAVMVDVGADRLFSKAIVEGGIDPGTFSFHFLKRVEKK